MKKRIMFFPIAVLTTLFVACTNNITRENNEDNKKYLERVNKICVDKDKLSIVTHDSKNINVRNLFVDDDSTSFINTLTGKLNKIPTANISKITFEGTGSSGFEGILFGGLVGGLTATLLTSSSTGDAANWRIVPISIGIGVGSLVGIIYSFIYPGSTVIFIKN